MRKNEKPKKPKKPLDKIKVAAIVVWSIIGVGFVCLIAGLIFMFTMLSGKPEVKAEDFISDQSTEIYDRNGDIIAEVGYVKRTNVGYEDLPNVVVDAFVATEDSRFFTHPGFDVARFSKAILENLKSFSFSQGGSTFTMQLIKNTYFVDDEEGVEATKSIERKVQEIALSFEVEDVLDKKTILELYLNKLNFGGVGNIRGIEKASLYYFGKSISEVNLNEAAFLAGVINAPFAYDPHNNIELANERKNQVLYLMNYHGYITDTEYELAKKVRVEDLLQDTNGNTSEEGSDEFQYQAYIDTVIQEVINETGLDPATTPMKIYTNMDPDVQSLIDDIQRGDVNGAFKFYDDLEEIASVVLNNETGEVIGVLGGRNYASGGALMLNHATNQYNQPGSSIKPLLDYTLAFENLGWSTSQTVLDGPIVIDGSVSVVNSEGIGVYNGEVSVTWAVNHSKNAPAARTLQYVVNKMSSAYVVEYLNNLGIDATQDSFSMQYAFGGASFRVSCLELASAQSMLFNGGVRVEPHTVKKIEFLNGRESIEIQSEETECVSAEAAFMTTELLKSNVNGGYLGLGKLSGGGYQVYAKTGTTDWGTDGLQYGIPRGASKESWLLASTSEFTVASWRGYEKAIKDEGTYLNQAQLNDDLDIKFTRLILDKVAEVYGTPESVKAPSGVSKITHIVNSYTMEEYSSSELGSCANPTYTRPIEGMSDEYIKTGYIKTSELNRLVDASLPGVDNMGSGFTATVSSSAANTIQINWPTYPDQDALKIAENTMDIGTYKGTVEKGTKLFDYSWITGPVQYKADISINGQLYQTVSSSEAAAQVQLTNVPAGTTIQVCGYYGYEKADVNPAKSNSSCQTIAFNDEEKNYQVPSQTASYEEVDAWMSSYGLIYEGKSEAPTAQYPEGTIEIRRNGEDVTGKTLRLKASELAASSWVVIVHKTS